MEYGLGKTDLLGKSQVPLFDIHTLPEPPFASVALWLISLPTPTLYTLLSCTESYEVLQNSGFQAIALPNTHLSPLSPQLLANADVSLGFQSGAPFP